MLPTETLNSRFIDLLNTDLTSSHKVTTNYVIAKMEELYPDATDVAVSIGKVANIIEIHISAKLDGESRFGSIVRTEMELLTSDKPVTRIFDDLIKDVFDAIEDN